MAIRYDKALNQEINRVVRNYNNKIQRLRKTDSNLRLPETVSVRGLKREMFSRKDLVRKLKDLELYSIRGMEKTITTEGGVDISRYEYRLLQKESRRVKSYLTRKINILNQTIPTVSGIRQDVSFAEMGSQQVANLIARREAITNKGELNKMKPEVFKRFLELINKNENYMNYQTSIFRSNYEDKMLFNLGYWVDYDYEKVKKIKETMNKLSDKEFLTMFESDATIRAIADYYPESHKDDPSRNADTIIELFDNLYENIDFIVDSYKK